MLAPAGGVVKASHKCWLCPRLFTSIPCRQRHYNTVHAAHGLPSQGNTHTLNDTPMMVGSAAEAGQQIDVDGKWEEPVMGDTSGLGGTLTTSASGAVTAADPAPSSTDATVPAAGRRTGAGAWVDDGAQSYVSPIRNDGMARGSVSGMRPVG